MHFLIQSLRPRQWLKNGFIVLPLIFAQKAFDYLSLFVCLSAVGAFCLASSAVYLVNDLVDLEADRKHPVKKLRPFAAGQISPGVCKVTAAILFVTSLLWAVWIGRGFLGILAIYLIVQLAYNYRLKEAVILDIFCVSSGFFLRVIAGAAAVQVEVSHWLIICTVLLSMLLALAKRRQEIELLGENEAGNHRKILFKYSSYLLDQMIGVITAGVLLSYMLYCVSPETIEKFHTDHLIYSFPFVLYGLFRYLYLIHRKNQGGEPEKILLSDLPLLLDVIMWVILCVAIIYGII